MRYAVLLSPRARRDLRRLPRDVSSRIAAALTALEEAPRPPDCRKLAATDQWRVRVGDYRVLYRVDDAARQLTVTRVAHRREVYRP